jgi:SAM-dependent methyltransferase
MTDAPRCLICDGPPSGPTFPYGTIWNGRRFDYLRCGTCGSSFVHPLPTQEEFGRMYERSNYHDRYYETTEEEPSQTLLPRLKGFFRNGGAMLDFGCGNGSFLMVARAEGFAANGVELEASAREQAAANSGCEVFAFEELLASGRRYDVIHLGDVLEHLPNPAGTMRDLEPLLAPGGAFFIEGPLEDNPSPVFYASRLFGAYKKLRRRTLHGDLPPFHLFRTSARAQRAFFRRRLGYKVPLFRVYESGWPYYNGGDERVWRPSSAGHLVRMLIGKIGILAGKALGRTPLMVGNRFAAIVAPAG